MQLEDYFEFLSEDDIRIKGHRIGIDHVLERYLDGYSAEEIASYYPTLKMVEIYATLTYYYQNRSEVDDYLVRLAHWREQHMKELDEREVPPVVKRIRALKAERAKQRALA